MNSNPRIERISSYALDEHLRQPHVSALKRFLTERGYASHTVYAYLDCVAHFSQWAERSDPSLARIDEAVVAQFIISPTASAGGRLAVIGAPRVRL
jgi:site-specific recombinase XerD